MPPPSIEALYADHHGWLKGWRLMNENYPQF